ncbi:unnamed protein product, partial [Polarella glacialis]
VLASSGWIGGQDLLSKSGGTLGSGKDNDNSNDNNKDNNNNSNNNDNKYNKKIAGWKHDAGSKYRVGRAPVNKSAGSICFHGLQHWPAWASKAGSRPSLVGKAFPAWHSATAQPPFSTSVRRFAEDKLKKLTRELSSATSAQALLSVLEQEEMSNFNEIHIGAAFTRLAKNKHTFTSAVRESPILRKLTARLLKMMDTENGLDARTCANVFWSIASLQSETPELQELLPRLIENAKFTAPDMAAQAVSNIVWACARSRLSSSQLQNLFPPILERLVDRADSLEPQHISNCIWASAKLKADVPEILEVIPVLMEMAEEKILDFNAQALVNIIWSGATLREEVPELQELLPALLKALPKQMDTLEAQHVANVVWSLGVLKAGDLAGNDVLGSLAKHGTLIIKRFKPQEVGNAAWGFALCGFQDVHFMSATVLHVIASVPSWSKKDLSLDLPVITWAFAMLKISDSALLFSTAKHIPQL